MDEWALLAILVFLIAVVLPIGLFFAQLGTNRKIRELRTEIEALKRTPRPSVQAETIAETPARWIDPESTPEQDPEPIAGSETDPIAASEPPAPEITPIWQSRANADETVDEPSTPKAFVFKEGFGEKIGTWLQKNWFFAVAAVSLALAGVFLVQYGVEKGLLTERMRVMAAIGLGAILIAVGEYVRRKLGDDEEGSFELMPSVFSGAGLVSIFAGILAARMLYGLIGPTPALIGLTVVGLCAIVFGWYYGPFLAIMGVFGALLAPFIVGGGGENAAFLYYFFAGIGAIALAIDSFKRWAWLSALGLIGTFVAVWVLYAAIGEPLHLLAFALIIAALALILPERRLIPTYDGAMLSDIVRAGQDKSKRPEFPTRVSGLTFIASGILIGIAFMDNPGTLWPVLTALSVMLIAAIFWLRHAPALSDLAFLPALGGLAAIYYEGFWSGDVWKAWRAGIERESLDFPPPTLAILLGGALVVTLIFAWRSWKGGRFPRIDAGFGAAFAVLIAIVLEVVWTPHFVLGETVWALYLAAVAVVMTVLTERFARIDREDRTRPALFALSAITMVSFMCFVLFGSMGLTISLAVLALAATVMAQRFNLPLLDYYTQVAAVAVSWRLVIMPGFVHAFDAPISEVLATYGISIGLLVAGYWLRRKDAGLSLRVVLESAVWSLGGVFACVLLVRFIDWIDADSPFVIISVIGTIWLILAFNQLWRIREGVGLRKTRIVLFSAYFLIGIAAVGLALTLFNPIFGGWFGGYAAGPYIFDNLFVAYAIPAVLFAFVAIRFGHIRMLMRKLNGAVAALLLAVYIGLEIRRWWHGPNLSQGPTTDGELYSYTVAMLVASAVLLGFAFVRKSALLRKLALAGVALTVAKVFLIDMSGLAGLIRVVSFLVLGLVLAAMAWVNRILQKNEAAE